MLFERPFKRIKRNATNWEKVFSNHICNKRLVLRMYIRDSQNAMVKKTKIIQLENGQQISPNISPKRIYRGQISTWKKVQYH